MSIGDEELRKNERLACILKNTAYELGCFRDVPYTRAEEGLIEKIRLHAYNAGQEAEAALKILRRASKKVARAKVLQEKAAMCVPKGAVVN